MFWWFRFNGEIRFAKRDETFTCADGLKCTCTANASKYSSSDGAVIWIGPRPHRECFPPKRAGQRWLMEYAEPAGYFWELGDAKFQSQFELTMGWRLSSSIVVSQALSKVVLGGPFAPRTWLNLGVLPNMSAIAWAAGPCPRQTPSKREQLVQDLTTSLGGALPVHAMGACLHNHDQPGIRDDEPEAGPAVSRVAASLPGRRLYWRKIRAYSAYRFCLVAENSIETDWITEKLFHAFAAGCLPIYHGAPNVASILPRSDAIVHVDQFASVEELAQHLLALASDAEALRRRLAWRADRKFVSRWWRQANALLNPHSLAGKEQQICAVCEAVHRTPPRVTRH